MGSTPVELWQRSLLVMRSSMVADIQQFVKFWGLSVLFVGERLSNRCGVALRADFRLRGETPGPERPPDESRLPASPYAAGRMVFRVTDGP